MEKPKSDPKQEVQPKVEEKKTTSFFADAPAPQGTTNAFFAQTSSGLFANLGKEDKKAGTSAQPEPKKGGLFANLVSTSNEESKPQSSFFGSAVTVTKTGLFDGLLNTGASNNTGCGTNLFNHTATPLSGMFANAGGNNEEDEEEGEGDEDEVPGQEDVTDPTKSTGNYKYEEKTTSIISVCSR